MNTFIILGAGQIGQGVYEILRRAGANRKSRGLTIADTFQTYRGDEIFVDANVQMWDKYPGQNVSASIDIGSVSLDMLVDFFVGNYATHIVNAMPFSFNAKVAEAAARAGCNYIDFTEDDEMAAKVQEIYAYSSIVNSTCVVKCGLAPGFINYIGHDLAKKIDKPERLMISVGALPRNISFSDRDPGSNYNLSWSVDGLVNEYIRPCQVRLNGREMAIDPLGGMETVMLDGTVYEMAFTSGGIGSLVKELKHIPNVYYKTMRYPGHYEYVRDALERNNKQFAPLKAEFLKKFPYTRDDVIVVYAECVGKMTDGTLRREVFANHYVGAHGLTGIQSTTAGGGVAVLELMLKGRIKGIVNHADIPLGMFTNTDTYQATYFRRT
jgi:saccharopine dehydrogenase-like NADP-dependent oxidoreductase